MVSSWARAVVDHELDAPWHRKYAVGCAYVRGMGQGRVIGVSAPVGGPDPLVEFAVKDLGAKVIGE